MTTERVNVWYGQDCIAKDVALDVALILVRALFREWYAQSSLKLTI